MQMSDGEILQRWNNAVDKKVHVEILADLNAVDKRTMHKKLVELGAEGLPTIEPKKRRSERQALKMDELRAMVMYRSGACDLEIADALGVTKPTVCQWRKRMRLEPNPQKRGASGLDELRAMRLYNEGLCDLDMAEALGVSRNTVIGWRKKHDLKCHRQKPGYVQQGIPKKPQDRTGQDRTGQDRTGQDRTGQDRTGQDRTGQDRTGQDRTGQDRRCAPVGKEKPVGKQEYMGIEGLLRLTQRMQEAFPQAKVTAGGRSVRDARVHICYNADGEAESVELNFVLEVEANEGNT